MKLLFTLLLFILISFASRSQNFILNFEDTTVINQVFYTDTFLDPQHIWQIGIPNKPLFDSAYSQPNAIVTLLDSALPPNVNASFIIGIPDSIYQLYQFNAYIGSALTFVHKFDFDSTRGGGYVEYSVDSGSHWHPVLMNGARYLSYYPYTSIYCITGNFGIPQMVDGQYIYAPSWWSYIPMDTTPLGIPYFTGTDSNWIHDTIVMPSPLGEKTYQNIPFLFKFTAFTDSNSLPREGWMIDNIGFQGYVFSCPGGINEINSSHIKVYPDPVTDGFTLSLTGAGIQDYSISIMDLTGRELLYREEQEPELTLKRGDIVAGSYFIKVTDKQTGNMIDKRVVFE